MSTAVQTKRFLSIDTPLGADVLLIGALRGSEALSSSFSYEVDLLCELPKESSVKADQLLGKPMSIHMDMYPPGATEGKGTPKDRYFHGVCSRFSVIGRDESFAYFQAQLVPWFSLFSQASDCRVFQEMSVPDVVEKLFGEWQGLFPFVAFENKLQENYTKIDYLIQYRETNFNFVSRVLEEEGIYYFYKHTKDKHTLVLADAPDAHEPCEHQGKVRFEPEAGQGEHEEDVIDAWRADEALQSGKISCRDYHFQMPSKTLEVSRPTKIPVGGNDKLEMYAFPGWYQQRFNKPDERLGDVEKEGTTLVDRRMEDGEVERSLFYGSGMCRGFVSGGTFEFELSDESSPPESRQGKYLITSVNHSAIQSPNYLSEETSDDPYRNSFGCVVKDVQFRPNRSTPKPVIHGLQSALVVGPSGEEIHTDKYGRVKVQFPWDREGKKDEKSSCWLRVAQLSAGKQWGGHFWPRIGHEVLVAFLEGDPDQPIIVGSVYNAENMPPYTLPDNQSRSGIKTRSTKDGSEENFNELRFEDKKDEEEIYVHAERDFNCVIENNETRKVGFDKTDKGNQEIAIYNDQTLEVGVGSGQGSQEMTIQKDRKVEIKQGNDTLEIGMGNREVTLKLGNETTKINLGKSEKTAMQSILLKVGQSSIKIDQMGVQIEGMMVKVNGTIMTEVKGGVMATLQGSAMTTVKGGILMIN